MTPEDSARLGELLLGQRLLALGVVAGDEPVVGLLPYAVAPDRTALLVQSSGLARHSRGLVAGAAWSGMIHQPDSPGSDPLQVPRLQLEGVVEPLAREGPGFEDGARAFLDRFPQAAMTLRLPDFGLFRLVIRGGRMVLGFGRALNLSGEHFRDLSRA